MAVTSWGYNGPLYQENWARLAAQMGVRHVVNPDSGTNPLRVAAIAGNRRISISPGSAVAAGVLVELDTAQVIDLEALAGIAVGVGRWYLVVLRRTWGEEPTSTIEAIYDRTTATITARTETPPTFPAAFRSEPGVVDDQPLAWVWFNGSNTNVQTFDLRKYPPTGTPQPTASTTAPLARTQIADPQAVHIEYVSYCDAEVIVNVPTRVFVDFQAYWYSTDTYGSQGVYHRLIHSSKGTIGGVAHYTVNNGDERAAPGVPVHIASSGFMTLEPGTHLFRAQMFREFGQASAYVFDRTLLVWEV